jgi:membrane-bound lytic murein transglycosylase B
MAIWGIETRFGAVTGTMPVIPAVATLAFDRRRSKYFRQQLFASLKMLHRGYISLPEMKGSWAGAMGQPQFMPSSYIAYARDFDGDGRRDIWSNEADVFASIANYLAEHGWNDDLTWGRKVIAPARVRRAAIKSFDRKERGCRAMKKMTRNKSLNEWARQGVTKADGAPLPSRNLPAAMVLPDGEKGPAYLVYKNYRSILRYNCAHLYAVTVGEMSDALWVR